MQGKKDFSLTIRFMVKNTVTKERLIREKHLSLFNVSFLWHESLQKWRPKELGKLFFYSHFWWKVDSQAEADWTRRTMVINWGELSKAASFSCFLVLCFSSRNKEGTLLDWLRALCPILEESQILLLWPTSGEGQRAFPASAVFSNTNGYILG